MTEVSIEEEIYCNIFHDPKFFEHFLSGPSAKLDAVLKYCRKTGVYAQRTNSWNSTRKVTRRSSSEPPLLKLLNTIVRGTHTVNPPSPDISLSGPALFTDWLAEDVQSGIEKHQLPNYLLFDNIARDWLGVRTAVRIMSRPGHRKMGMAHLAIYAKAMFSHQLHRRHIYHLTVCGTEATFVRFDRAGILYSSAIDLCKDAGTFIRALASLIMLNRVDEGFDPLFSVKLDANNLVVYTLDLPASAIPSQSNSDQDESPKRKFQVTEFLRHNTDIVGSATSVLVLREVLEPTKRSIKPLPKRGKGKRKQFEAASVEEQLGDTEYILKMVWRDPRGCNESELYKKTDGMYGIGQYTWASDASRPCTCAEPTEECTTCVVEVGHIPGLEVCNVLNDLVFAKEEFDSDGGDDDEGPELDTSKYHRATRKRPNLICSYILMSSIGVPLRKARTPQQYMGVVLDAVLGYWRIFNLGYIHRDISDGNVMILQPDQAFTWREWKEPVTELSDIEDKDIRNSEQKLREVVASLNRDPIGMLLDFNLCVEHSGKEPVESKTEIEFHGSRKRMSGIFDAGSRKRQRPNITKCYAYRESSEPLSDSEAENPVIEYRTGTTPFMATAVLGSTFSKPYRHSYLDDLESFFWLIYTAAVYHIDGGQDSNIYQEREFAFLTNPDMTKAAKHKVRLVDQMDRMLSSLDRYDNSWAKSHTFRHVLSELRDFFRDVWNKEDSGMTPVEAFTRVTDVLLDVAQ